MTQEDVQLFMSMSMTGSNRNIYSYQAHIWYTRYGSVCQGRVMMYIYIYICRARTQCSLLCADFYMAMSVCTYGIIYGYTYCNIYIYISYVYRYVDIMYIYIYLCIQICIYIYTEIHVYVPVANISYLSTYPYIYIYTICVCGHIFEQN